jgi:ABC-type histidine transport system ATPase subunit
MVFLRPGSQDRRFKGSTRDFRSGFAREAATRNVFMNQGRIVETAELEPVFTSPQTWWSRQVLARDDAAKERA